MGTCIGLILLAWNVVRFWSTTAAVVMSVIAAVIPPVAVIVGNAGTLRRLEKPRSWPPGPGPDGSGPNGSGPDRPGR
ncbi:hypothetical protein H9L09_02350 [Nocardioides mesophilus]|uniref:DUF3099 domain-containing protein n=2 Tax=Nocardioides mesophilus TaxID=433659 RepID=A0A7G9RGQ4_9ACTN|nr:hypothetical protein H9L09_02350 [Nocardioides mesophilus]